MDAVEPVQALLVPDPAGLLDLIEPPLLGQLVHGEDFLLGTRSPADQGEEVDDRLGDVALVAELPDRGRAVAL